VVPSRRTDRLLVDLTLLRGCFFPSSHTHITVDEMGTRIDDLEKSIGELMSQAGIPEDENLDANDSKREG